MGLGWGKGVWICLSDRWRSRSGGAGQVGRWADGEQAAPQGANWEQQTRGVAPGAPPPPGTLPPSQAQGQSICLLCPP